MNYKKFIKFLPFIIFSTLAFISSRGFLSKEGLLGHNWDWNIPYFSEQLKAAARLGYLTWLPNSLGKSNLLGISGMPLFIVMGALGALGMSGAVFSRLFVFFVFIISSSSMYLLISFILRSSVNQKLGSLVGGLFYGFSPFLFNHLIGGAITQIFSYSILPLVLLFYLKYEQDEDGLSLNLLAAVLFLTLVAVSHQALILISVLLLLRTIFFKGTIFRSLRRFVLVYLLFVILNLYWLLPALYELFAGLPPTSAETFSSPAAFENVPTLAQAFINLGYWREFYSLIFQGKIYYLFLINAFLAFILLILYANVFYTKERLRRESLFSLLVLFLSFVLVTGSKDPLGNLVLLLYQKVFLLNFFRSPQHFILLSTFLLSILLGTGSAGLVERFGSKRRELAGVLLLSTLFWTSGFYITGDIGSSSLKSKLKGGNYIDQYKLPKGYKGVYEILKAQSTQDSRVLIFPPVYSPYYLDNDYQDEGQGGDPFIFFSPKSIISRTGSDNLERDLIKELSSILYSSKTFENLIPFLNFLNVEYIVVRRDAIPAFGDFSGVNINDAFLTRLKDSPLFEPIYESEVISLFKLKGDFKARKIGLTNKVSFIEGSMEDISELVSLSPKLGNFTFDFSESSTGDIYVVGKSETTFDASRIFTIKRDGKYKVFGKNIFFDDPQVMLEGTIEKGNTRASVWEEIGDLELTESGYLLNFNLATKESHFENPDEWQVVGGSNNILYQLGKEKVNEQIVSATSAYESLALMNSISDYQSDSLYYVSLEYKTDHDKLVAQVRDSYKNTVLTFPVIDKENWHPVNIIHSGKVSSENADILIAGLSKFGGSERSLKLRNVQLRRILKPGLVLHAKLDDEDGGGASVSYKQLSPTRYEVVLSNLEHENYLIFSENYHPGWRLSQFNETHKIVNGYANMWTVRPEDSTKSRPLKLTIEFFPQKLVWFGLGTSLIAWAVIILGLVIRGRRQISF